ncbi:PEGA domain-containing protein [Thermococcus sp.]|uniref:PEGA domain-containing protein n=1 Tax=Thermococcus sp. TaxID=35749 RepID=UPI002607AA1F|nr:PEGA domain-containing protein [Thermococcus sp.]
MKRLLSSLLFVLLFVAIPVGAWVLKLPLQEHHEGMLSDATALNGSIYAIGLETYVSTFNVQWVGNTTLFKIGPNGNLLAKYIITGGFCDEETWPSLGIESYGDEIIAYGVSCVPRFKNKTSWIIALDGDGRYKWGFSLPGYIAQAEVWNGSIVAAIAYREGDRIIPVMLWADPITGKIERMYLIPLADPHAVLRFEIDENGEIIVAGYDEKMLSWAGIIYPNNTIRVWDTGVEAWDGPSVWAVGNESRFLIAVGWSNGTYLINPITASALFVEDTYPYALMVINNSPVMVSPHGRGKSIFLRLNWNGSVESVSFLADFTVLFVSDGLMGGYSGDHYSLAPFQPGQEVPMSLKALPAEPKINEIVLPLKPINVTVHQFKPVIVAGIPNQGLATLRVATTPPGAEVYINGSHIGRTPLNLNLTPGNCILKLVKEGYKNKTLNLTLSPGTERDLTVRLEPLSGRLLISSTPANLTATIIGGNMNKNCTTPCSLSLPLGKYTVNVSNGKGWKAADVYVGVNSTSTVSLAIPVPKKGSRGPLLLALVLLALGGAGAYVYMKKPAGEEVTRTEKAHRDKGR